MTELEQLRKEVNELRERVAQLEWKQKAHGPFGPAPVYPNQPPPVFFPPSPNTFPFRHDIWCTTTVKTDE